MDDIDRSTYRIGDMKKTIVATVGLLAMVLTIFSLSEFASDLPGWLYFGGYDTQDMFDIARDRWGFSDSFVILALVGVVPAVITILFSIIPKKIPVIGSKWFNVLVCAPVFFSYYLLWWSIEAATYFSGEEFTYDVPYYLWLFGLGLTFIAAFFNNRSSTKTE